MDEHPELSKDPQNLLRLGFEARRAHRLEVAHDYMIRAVALARIASDVLLFARTLTGLGQIERDLQRLPKALNHYAEALVLMRLVNDPILVAHTGRHVGDLHLELNQLSEAETHLREALALYRAERRTGTLDLANTVLSVAILETRLEHLAAARALLEEASALYHDVGVLSGVHDCSNRLRALLFLPSEQPPTE